ncbi:hypothetical protein GC163_19180 [bacterium]|nr:hypothetical protein [bacterium]
MSTAALPSTAAFTADEFYDYMQRAENRHKHCELEDGEIVELSVPKKLHGLICANVAFFLISYVKQRGSGYVCSNDSGFITQRDPDTVRGVDVAYFEDASSFEEVEAASPKYSSVPPVLAVEVLSPDVRTVRVMQKVGEYLTAGVKEIWIIDPEAREVAVHRVGQPLTILLEGDAAITGSAVLPDFELPLAEIFRLPKSANPA